MLLLESQLWSSFLGCYRIDTLFGDVVIVVTLCFGIVCLLMIRDLWATLHSRTLVGCSQAFEVDPAVGSTVIWLIRGGQFIYRARIADCSSVHQEYSHNLIEMMT